MARSSKILTSASSCRRADYRKFSFSRLLTVVRHIEALCKLLPRVPSNVAHTRECLDDRQFTSFLQRSNRRFGGEKRSVGLRARAGHQQRADCAELPLYSPARRAAWNSLSRLLAELLSSSTVTKRRVACHDGCRVSGGGRCRSSRGNASR